MGEAGFFRGTSTEQDSRFSDKQKKLLKSINFPAEFSKKVNFNNVNLTVIKPWIAKRITELMGVEDEVMIEYAFGLLETDDVDPRKMQIDLTGFLESNASIFMKELWNHLLSAQESIGGIPKLFLEQKKLEIAQKLKNDKIMLEEIAKREEMDRQSSSTSNTTRDDKDESHSSHRAPSVSELVQYDSPMVKSSPSRTPSSQADTYNDSKRNESANRRSYYSRDHSRDKRNDRERDRDDSIDRKRRSRDREDERSRGRDYDRDRNDRRDKDRPSDYDRRDRDRERDRARDRDHRGNWPENRSDRDRDRERERERDRDRVRDRDRERERERERDRERDRDRDHKRKRTETRDRDSERRSERRDSERRDVDRRESDRREPERRNSGRTYWKYQPDLYPPKAEDSHRTSANRSRSPEYRRR